MVAPFLALGRGCPTAGRTPPAPAPDPGTPTAAPGKAMKAALAAAMAPPPAAAATPPILSPSGLVMRSFRSLASASPFRMLDSLLLIVFSPSLQW